MDYRIYYPENTYPDIKIIDIDLSQKEYDKKSGIGIDIDIQLQQKDRPHSKRKKKVSKRLPKNRKKRINKLDIIGCIVSYAYLMMYVIGMIYIAIKLIR
jgi:hypothetical protein